MPYWNSPEELKYTALTFERVIHLTTGLYAYEVFMTLGFEWELITGKKRFRWPLIFYFINRYLQLFALIMILISLDTRTKINCQVLYSFIQIVGNSAVGAASINLSLRTMAVWGQNRYLNAFLVLVILGHFSLILQGIHVTAIYVEGEACQLISTKKQILAAIFIYSMCFDFLILCLTGYKLVGRNSHLAGSRLAKTIFEDGLIYFIIAFVGNLIATVFMLLSLNPFMTVIGNIPAATASTIVSCRVVRRLLYFERNTTISDIPTIQPSRLVIRGHHGSMTTQQQFSTHPFSPKGAVRVEMETYTQSDSDHPRKRDIEAEAGDLGASENNKRPSL